MLAVADQVAARPKCDLAHVFRAHGADYRRTHRSPFSHIRVMQAIEDCRTSFLGGHMEQCNLCGFQHPAYDSCRNRYCPKCQSLSVRPLPTALSRSQCTFASSLGNLCLGVPSVARAADSFKSVLTLKSPESLHHPCQTVSVAPICSCYNPHRQP